MRFRVLIMHQLHLLPDEIKITFLSNCFYSSPNSSTVSDVNTTTDNTAPAPTIANDGATNTVGAEEGSILT